MKVAANIKYLKISAQKLRLGADLVRGQRALDAQELLMNMPQKSARMIAAGLKSAIANAENNYSLNSSTLQIDEIRVDQGPKLKRGRPRARGAYGKIEHPMAHLRIVLDSGKEEPKTEAKKSAVKSETKPKVTTKITNKKRGLK
ncbi:50S ribosomal protein L22 [Candidatus Saccharibacteria bacterium]|jgi:large subunit ribosomal protein L22|nr:50S ribosomal protein L22 [Candidatus Saccharibacteria bacterium]